MREMDIVEITIEKKRYAKEGVHRGMQQQWTDKARVLSAERNFREKFLLLAP